MSTNTVISDDLSRLSSVEDGRKRQLKLAETGTQRSHQIPPRFPGLRSVSALSFSLSSSLRSISSMSIRSAFAAVLVRLRHSFLFWPFVFGVLAKFKHAARIDPSGLTSHDGLRTRSSRQVCRASPPSQCYGSGDEEGGPVSPRKRRCMLRVSTLRG